MWEYLKLQWDEGRGTGDGSKRSVAKGASRRTRPSSPVPLPPIDRTYNMFIVGKQARPDAPYPRAIVAPDGRRLAEVGEGNRKDVRNAVEAARAAEGWAHTTGHTRGQILYYIAENLATRTDEFAARIDAMTGCGPERARAEVDARWYFGNQVGAGEVGRGSAGNMKRTWADWHARDWLEPHQGEGREFLREATQVKNIWIPYGE